MHVHPTTPAAQCGHAGKGKGYSDVIGKTVDIPGRVFGVDIPDLYYRAVVRKKDPGHSRAVVVRTVEDNDVYWFPVDAVRGWLEAMATSGRDIHSGTVGEASDAYAAEVLSELISNKSSLQHQAASACRSDAFTSAAVAPNGCLVDVSQRHRDGRSIPPSAQGSPAL
ncbi:hypothetical protein WJX72_004136 [[Myrmecia] bisecta]|uniref:Uncharacterized protein n=1 Tax=[Myrmecia] bisecta TaxID=41462 RepID=A0AAW1Q1J8_9CHLO